MKSVHLLPELCRPAKYNNAKFMRGKPIFLAALLCFRKKSLKNSNFLDIFTSKRTFGGYFQYMHVSASEMRILNF